MVNERTRSAPWGGRWISWLYLFLAVLAVAALGLAAWATAPTSPANLQAKRWGDVQLRTLRLARDRIQEQMLALQRRLLDISELPEVLTAATDTRALGKAIDRALGGVVFDDMHVQRFDPTGKLVGEIRPTLFPRDPQDSEMPTDLEDLMLWARNDVHRTQTLIDIKRSDEDRLRDDPVMIRCIVPVWRSEPPADDRFLGLLMLRFPVQQFLGYYLPPTHPMPEAYSFVVESGREADKPALGVVWHWQEPQWVLGGSAAADAFVERLLASTGQGAKEGSTIVDLPRSDGGERKEIVSYVLLNLGSRRWLVGLSTPFDDAVLFTGEQQVYVFVLGGFTLAVLAVGFVLLYYQRTRLRMEASEEQRAQLETLQHNYQDLFAENPTAMLVLHPNGKIVDCNHSSERLLGLSRAEAQSQTLSDVFEPDSIELLWTRLGQTGQLAAVDARLIRKSDQRSTLVEAWGRRIGDHLILMAQDVEQRRDLDRQLARFRRMDSVGSLASTLAHDFNNTLGQVQILVSNLKSEVATGSEILEDLTAIEDKIEDASQLVGNLLSFRETVISEAPVYLEPILREFVSSQKKLLSDKIELVAEIRPDLPAVWIQPHSLRRILDNLCLNATDAMPYGGTLTIRARGRWIEPAQATDQLRSDHYCVIEVADTGIGMSQDLLEKSFEPFFTTKGEGQGTGLGLWTIYKILRRVRGAIHVHSEPGRGTRFAIYLAHTKPTEDIDTPGLELARPSR